MGNHLEREQSPYLLQHVENPVDWYPWGPDAFGRAKSLDRPILLSIGYSTCHWCHVMAHESFEDPEAAEVINSKFIAVKVDREERPDVDAVYMAACIAMNGSGGWPLTVLLTPDQRPFWAGTYLPKKQLLSLLAQVAMLWQRDRDRLLAAGDELTAHLKSEDSIQHGTPSRDLVIQAVALYAQSFDQAWGGFGPAPKFPTPHQLVFLLRYSQRTGDAHAQAMAEQTLEAMFRGGLFDHVGGGFSRYATDEKWLVPHFEKMLYDNALLALAYTEAFQATHRPLYRQAATRTLDYMLRELSDPLGGFYCGQDADCEGVEGKYYVFTPDELLKLLGPDDFETFCRWYGVTQDGNFEGQSIPNLIGREELDSQPERIQALREKVYRYRLSRMRLHCDDKILTAWNGLAIAALARAGLAFHEPRYLKAAECAAEFIKVHLMDGGEQLLARWRQGEAAHPGKLDDYAFYAWGLLELYQVNFRPSNLMLAKQLANDLLTFFFDPNQGGFYPYASNGEQLITRSKECYDGALPSGNSVCALLLSRLARLTGETHWQTAAELQFSFLAGAVSAYPAGYGFSMLAMLERLWPTRELVCAAQRLPQVLLDFLREGAHPELTVLVKTPETEQELALLAPFTAGYPVPADHAVYYLCSNGACAQPTDDFSQVILFLKKKEQLKYWLGKAEKKGPIHKGNSR